MPRLDHKIALITGASRGIGRAISELFAGEGATVIATDIDEQAGESFLDRLDNAEYRHLDVSLEADWQQLSQYIKERYGRLDILVNNAGITGIDHHSSPLDPEHFDLASWHHIHSINLDGVALGCKYAIGLMKSSSAASIVNMSSRSGLVGIPGAAAYASSKAAVRNHSKSVALYCAGQGYPIRCNSIHPGAILTPLWDSMLGEGPQREQAIQTLAADVPLGVMGDAMDVAYAALYLASDEAKYVTGIELNVDGGILAGSSAAPAARD